MPTAEGVPNSRAGSHDTDNGTKHGWVLLQLLSCW